MPATLIDLPVEIVICVGHFLDMAKCVCRLRSTCKSLWSLPLRALMMPSDMFIALENFSLMRRRPRRKEIGHAAACLEFVDVGYGQMVTALPSYLFAVLRENHSHIIQGMYVLGLFSEVIEPDYWIALTHLLSFRRRMVLGLLLMLIRKTPVGAVDIMKDLTDAMRLNDLEWPGSSTDLENDEDQRRVEYDKSTWTMRYSAPEHDIPWL